MALTAAALVAAGGISAQPALAAGYTLRVYSDNMENLVTNLASGDCRKVTGTDHLNSMLADGAAPDALILQQVRGASQISAYANQVSARFGLPAGTYKYVVAWDDPEDWGGSHSCNDASLGDLKKKQTNGIIYNSNTLALTTASGNPSTWSSGWFQATKAASIPYNGGQGCRIYKAPYVAGSQSYDDDRSAYTNAYKRTTAIAAQFTYKPTGTLVGIATQHFDGSNASTPCGGAGSTGIGGTGLSYGATASALLNNAAIRLIGVDANRTGIPANTLSSQFGVTSLGSANTFSDNGDGATTKKIDYLFANGSIQPSSSDYTQQGTKSNHRALYAFINL